MNQCKQINSIYPRFPQSIYYLRSFEHLAVMHNQEYTGIVLAEMNNSILAVPNHLTWHSISVAYSESPVTRPR